MTQAVIRVRGDINVRSDISRTLKLLRLNRVNHCILLSEDEISKGMLNKVKDYVTWGEVKPEVVARMIVMRGRLTGDNTITNDYLKEHTKHSTIIDFAKAITQNKIKYSNLKDVKPIFRLHPPLKGYEGIKRSFKVGGALGYRGDSINDLIIKMLGPEKKKPTKKKAVKKKKKVTKKAKTDKKESKAKDDKKESKPPKKESKTDKKESKPPKKEPKADKKESKAKDDKKPPKKKTTKKDTKKGDEK